MIVMERVYICSWFTIMHNETNVEKQMRSIGTFQIDESMIWNLSVSTSKKCTQGGVWLGNTVEEWTERLEGISI